ncbi:MAG: helix-turn-helix transcriptional regulator [Oscillospiraceae bacterium]|nr:helix-turn-helix transcriptional regulator [Oscillospiraceae bacterium]
MQLNLGTTIRKLRYRDGRTQEALADALGVTSQAVSRWEANGSYPDMESIPAIANYFGITIDELFGYQNNRDNKIDQIIRQIDSYSIKSRSDDQWVDECLLILREGLAEFPKNERLMITLADTLSEAGWRRHHEWLYYDDEGFIQHNYDKHKKNEYWSESVKICEYLVHNASDSTIVTKAIKILVLLYRNFGETEKAITYAMKMPSIKNCRELFLAAASDGKEEARYIGEFLLKSASQFSEQLIYGLIANRNHYESDLPIEKIKGAISLFYLICDDGNMGLYHGDLIKMYLYLSRLQWERGYHDEAFDSLESALNHAKSLEELCDGKEHTLTAPLVSFVKYKAGVRKDIAKSLPDDWPFWCNPDYSAVEKGIKADPRWNEWVERTQA